MQSSDSTTHQPGTIGSVKLPKHPPYRRNNHRARRRSQPDPYKGLMSCFKQTHGVCY